MRELALATALALAPALVALTGCPDGEEGSDAGTATDAAGGSDSGGGTDSGGGSDSGGGTDRSATDQTTPQPDAAQPDAAVVWAQEITLGYDDGLPALKLVADPLAEGRLLVTPDAALLPVEVRKVRFIPTTAYSATLRVTTDQYNAPGTVLVQRDFTVTAGDVDDWFEIDLGAEAVQVDGNFWIVVVYPTSLGALQEVMYGGTSSSGHNYYYKIGYPPYLVNFDQIMRVVVGTPSEDPVDAPGGDGADCATALDCASGYCSGGRCTVTCSGPTCGANGACRSFANGGHICVTGCNLSYDCAASAFCLTDTSLLDSANFCIQGGPLADGEDCQYHYHTVCEHGHCSACDSDPTTCGDPGTCGSTP